MSEHLDAERGWRALLDAMRTFHDVLPGGTWTEAGGIAATRSPTCPVPILNGVWLLGDASVEGVLEAVASLEAEGLPAPVIVREGRSAAFEAAVPERGFAVADRTPLMVTTPAELRAVDAEGLEPSLVDDPAGLDQARRTAEGGFGVPDGLIGALYGPPVSETDGLTTAVARVRARPVSTAQTMRIGDDVGIYGVATPEGDRGRGYGGALTGWVTARAFEAGATFAYLQSSPMGVSVYRRIGFREVDVLAMYMRLAPG
ncbi:MAG TPA: hypothetical protein VK646_06580 [Actinomycetota bacterium]|nr:hypothetical protein [Actinomycetota bacterium]